MIVLVKGQARSDDPANGGVNLGWTQVQLGRKLAISPPLVTLGDKFQKNQYVLCLKRHFACPIRNSRI